MANTTPKALGKRFEEIKREIALKSAQNPAFRRDLKSNPVATIEKEYGLSGGTLGALKITVLEETPTHIIIPIPQSTENIQLTDEQLEAVAGGVAFVGALVGAIVTAAASVAVAQISSGRRW